MSVTALAAFCSPRIKLSICEKKSHFNKGEEISHPLLTSEENAHIMRGVKKLHVAAFGGEKMQTIKDIREARGISQEGLAQMLGVDRSTVAKWETRDVYPRGDKIVALADALNCSIDALYGRTPPEAAS